jgi:DNA repair exonuclease SbcCD nuclease subunit
VTRFFHAADLHVDSPLRGLDRYEGAPVERLRGATRRALENLVTACIEERVAFLLLAGDVFDGAWKDYSTGLFFCSQMTRLREAGIAVVLVRGNHDAQSEVVKALRLPDNVEELSAKKPESFGVPGTNVVVHGQSFAKRITSDDLAARYPDRQPGAINVGLLHTSVDGREGHEPYAPTSIATMRAKGYDYWALGHVHAREVLSEEPWIVFPGNLQGRHARETGAKGASLVTIADGHVAAVEHRSFDVVRWEHVVVDVSDSTDAIDAVDHVRVALADRAGSAAERVLAARVFVTGATRANAAIRRDLDRFTGELRAAAGDVLGDGVFVEKVKIETRSVFDLAQVRKEASAVGHLARRLEALKSDAAEIASLAAVLADLDKRLPPELREGDGALTLSDPATIRRFVEEVEAALLPRLLEGAEG